jgi:hypothetical protein
VPENEVTGTEGRRKANGAANVAIGDGGWEVSDEEVHGEELDDTWFLKVHPRTK